jgi:Rrf2 family protein
MNKLINISEASSIAIHSMALIAKLNKHINATQIAEMTGFSKNHLSKILQLLVKHGYLQSNRGPKGGFYLDKNPNEISLLEIYELIEGKVTNDFFFKHNTICPFLNCVYGDIVKEVSDKFYESFKNRFLSDIEWKEGVNSANLLNKTKI